MSTPSRLFWLAGLSGGKTSDLNGISAEDCAGDAGYEKLKAGCGAIVYGGAAVSFYACRQASSPPAESHPDIVYPRRNLVHGDPLYWELMAISYSFSGIETAVQLFTGVETKDFAHTADDNIPIVQTSYTLIPAPYDDDIEYLTADEGDYVQEDTLITNFKDDLIEMESVGGGADRFEFIEAHDIARNYSNLSVEYRNMLPSSDGKVMVIADSWLIGTIPQFRMRILGYQLPGPTFEILETSASQSLGNDNYGSGQNTVDYMQMSTVAGLDDGSSDWFCFGYPMIDGSKPEQGLVRCFKVFEGSVTTNLFLHPPSPGRNGQFGRAVGHVKLNFFKRLMVGDDLGTLFIFNETMNGLSVSHDLDRNDYAVRIHYLHSSVVNSWALISFWNDSENTFSLGSLYFTGSFASFYEHQNVAQIAALRWAYSYINTVWWFIEGGGTVLTIRKSGTNQQLTILFTFPAPTGFNYIRGSYQINTDDTFLVMYHNSSTEAYALALLQLDRGAHTLTELYRMTTSYICGSANERMRPAMWMVNADDPTKNNQGFLYGSNMLYDNIDHIRRHEFQPGVVFVEGDAYVVTTSASSVPLANILFIDSCTITYLEPANCAVRFLISLDGRATWLKWDGATWVAQTSIDDVATGNAAAEVTTGLTGLDVAAYDTFDVVVWLERLAGAGFSDTPALLNIRLSLTPAGGEYIDVNMEHFTIQSQALLSDTIVGDGTHANARASFLGETTV